MLSVIQPKLSKIVALCRTKSYIYKLPYICIGCMVCMAVCKHVSWSEKRTRLSLTQPKKSKILALCRTKLSIYTLPYICIACVLYGFISIHVPIHTAVCYMFILVYYSSSLFAFNCLVTFLHGIYEPLQFGVEFLNDYIFSWKIWTITTGRGRISLLTPRAGIKGVIALNFNENVF